MPVAQSKTSKIWLLELFNTIVDRNVRSIIWFHTLMTADSLSHCSVEISSCKAAFFRNRVKNTCLITTIICDMFLCNKVFDRETETPSKPLFSKKRKCGTSACASIKPVPVSLMVTTFILLYIIRKPQAMGISKVETQSMWQIILCFICSFRDPLIMTCFPLTIIQLGPCSSGTIAKDVPFTV